MRARAKAFFIAACAVSMVGGAAGTLMLLLGAPSNDPSQPLAHPVWTEARWPFPTDQWGRGKAFGCKAADCGTDVSLYLRAKLGFCDCTTGVADDEDVERMGDLDLIGEVSPFGAGRPINIAPLKGRSRAYTLKGSGPPGKTAISFVLNDRCDMIVATAVLGHDRPNAAEPGLLEFLKSDRVMRWVEATLGL